MPSCNNYRLTWVSLTPDVGYLFTAVPAKCSCCSLFWMRGISSKGIMLWSHLNLYFVVVTPNVMVCGNGAFGSFRSCNEGGTLKVGFRALIWGDQRAYFPPSRVPHEVTMGWQLFASQEESSHQVPILSAPWSWISQPLELWEIHVCCFVIAAWAKVFCVYMFYQLAVPLLGIYLEKTRILKDTCTPVFIAALFQ